MPDTNPRSLIQRLADDLEGITEQLVIPEYAHTEKERTDASLALVAEARAYLAQSEPDDSSAFIAWILFDPDGKLRPEAQEVLAARGIAQPEPEGPTDEELEDFALQNGGGYFNCDCREEADILTRKHVSNYRAILARWGK
jgi:hypothetical protein